MEADCDAWRSTSGAGVLSAILHRVGDDQHEGPDEDAQQEEAKEAMPLAAGDARRPERQSQPDQPDDDNAEPAEERDSENHVLLSRVVDELLALPTVVDQIERGIARSV